MLTQLEDTVEKAGRAVESLQCMKPENSGMVKMSNCHNVEEEILIPVSASIMMPGKLESVDHVYVSVGAGYVVEKTVADAHEFFQAKTKLIEPNIKQIRNQAMSVEEQLPIVQQVGWSGWMGHGFR